MSTDALTVESVREMDITGYDSVVFTFTRLPDVIAAVRAAVLARWPAALIDGVGEHTASERLADTSVERMSSSDGHLQFFRDAEMFRHAEESGYVPTADGEGPFMVIVRERHAVVFELAGVDEKHAADHTPRGPRPPDSYPAWMCSPVVTEVTAVTPGDPAAHDFSAWVLDVVRRACGGGGAKLGDPAAEGYT